VKKFLCALALTVAFAGFSQADTVAKPASKTTTTPGKPGPDAQIEHTIQLKFAKSKINAEHFTVSVHGGVATLEGKTGVIQHKGVATRLAKAGGASSVKNHIQVSEEAKARAAAHLANGKKASGTGELAQATVLPK
jgi:hypothetical protein